MKSTFANLAAEARGSKRGENFQWDGVLKSRDPGQGDFYFLKAIPTAKNPANAKVGSLAWVTSTEILYVCTTGGVAAVWAALNIASSNDNEAAASALTNGGLGGADTFLGSVLGAQWILGGNPTATVRYSSVSLTPTVVVPAAAYIMSRTFAPAGAFEVHARVALTQPAIDFGFYVAADAAGAGPSNAVAIIGQQNVNQTNLYSIVGGAFNNQGGITSAALSNRWIYMRLVRDGANNFNTYIGNDRAGWIPVGPTLNRVLAINSLGVRFSSDNITGLGGMSVDFIDVIS